MGFFSLGSGKHVCLQPMEGIMKHWSNLSLNEREDGTLNLSRERSSGEAINLC